jgi:hypothetical protein
VSRVRVAGDDHTDSPPVEVERQVRKQISNRGAEVWVVVDARRGAYLKRRDFAPPLCQLRLQEKRA